LSKDGEEAWAILQSPLGDKKNPEFKSSLRMRAFRFNVSDPLKATLTGVFGFENSPGAAYPSSKGKPAKETDLKLGSAQLDYL
jgi:hypothetical protein